LKGVSVLRTYQNFAATITLLTACSFASPSAAKSPPLKLPEASTALGDYVKRPDASYAWQVRQRGKQGSGD
jgi:hypothetical protein